MAIAYTWGIASLERNLPAGDVYTAHWTLIASTTDTEVVTASSTYGSIGLSQADSESLDFIPYESLTQEVVIGWVKEALGGEEKVAEMEASLVTQIEEQLAPKRASGTPW